MFNLFKKIINIIDNLNMRNIYLIIKKRIEIFEFFI